MGSRIEAEKAACRAQGARSPMILEGLSFSIAAGECVALMGASGIGKTTLLRAIAGQTPLDSGRLLIDGEPPLAARGRVFYQSQGGGVFPWLTVEEHLRLRRSWNRAEVDDVAATLRLEEVSQTYAAQLSGGERKRLSLALTLIAARDVALLDESFAGLDVDVKRAAMGVIDRVRSRRGLTILLVSHAVEECVALCSRVLFLKGRPARVASELSLARAAGTTDAALIERLQSRLDEVLSPGP